MDTIYNLPATLSQEVDDQGRLERELTTQIQFPPDVQFIEAADLLELQYGSRAIHGLMPLGGNRMQVTFNTPAFVAHAMAKGVTCRNEIIEFKEITKPSIWIVVRNCPLEMSNDAVGRLFSQYGTVERNFKDVDRKRGWYNGNRKIRMKMLKPIPNILHIGIYPIYVSYDGVEQLCRRCSLPNHQAFECKTPFCHKCRKLGHSMEDCTEKKKPKEPEREKENEYPELVITEKNTKDQEMSTETELHINEALSTLNEEDNKLINEILSNESEPEINFEIPELLRDTTNKTTERTTERQTTSKATSNRSLSSSPERGTTTPTQTRSKSTSGKPFSFLDKDSEKMAKEINDRKIALSIKKKKKDPKKD